MDATCSTAPFRVALTGGIGSGKSYVCRLLEQRGIRIYDCDAAAKRLLRTSAPLQEQLARLVGQPIVSDGQIDKALLSRYLLTSEDNQQRLNAVIHPAVIDDFLHSSCTWMESAILFESGYAHIADCIVCVTCPDDIRIRRICHRDNITPAQAQQWIDRQWQQEEVLRRSHIEIVNDGTTPLPPQIDNMLQRIHAMQQEQTNQ